jgi:hypothetical protein
MEHSPDVEMVVEPYRRGGVTINCGSLIDAVAFDGEGSCVVVASGHCRFLQLREGGEG